MSSGLIVVVALLVGLTLLALIPRLPVPDFGRVVRENRWRKEAARWRDGGGPGEVVRTYRGREEMERDRARLAQVGYGVVDEHWELPEERGPEAMPTRDSMAMARLQALSRSRRDGPEVTVTYARDPSARS